MFKLTIGYWSKDILTDNLDEAMETADDEIAYTQENVNIYDENNNLVAMRHWWGYDVENDIKKWYGEDEYEALDDDEQDNVAKEYISDNDIIIFGSAGFYSAWEVL